MNKSYKVLFNTFRGTSAVVSEIASSKQSRKKATVVVAVAVAMGMMTNQVMAGESYSDYYGQSDKTSFNVSKPNPEVTNGFSGTWTSSSGGGSGNASNLYGGYSADSSDVYQNFLKVSGGTIHQSVYAGYSNSGSAGTTAGTGNSVLLSGNATLKNESVSVASGSTEYFGAFGGWAGGTAANKANYNSVTIKDNASLSYSGPDKSISGIAYAGVFGGFNTSTSADSSASHNSVSIEGGTIELGLTESGSGNAWQGTYGGLSLNGSAESNNVSISGGTFTGKIYGGYVESDSGTGSTNYNTVSISGGTFGRSIYGGSARGSGSAKYNTVSISGGTIVTGDSQINIVGGYMEGPATGTDVKSVSNNLVTISGGTFTQANSKYISVCGGQAVGTATASANSVLISGMSGAVHNVYGGSSSAKPDTGDATANASNNIVTLSGGTINGNVYGGYAYAKSTSSADATATANNNTVILNGATISGNVYGAFASAAVGTGNPTAVSNNNAVIWKEGNLTTAFISGGSVAFKKDGDGGSVSYTFSGNTFAIIGSGKLAKGVSAFQNYLFVLDGNAATTPMLTVSDQDALALDGKVSLTLAKNSSVSLKKDDKVTLLALTKSGAELTNSVTYSDVSTIASELSTAGNTAAAEEITKSVWSNESTGTVDSKVNRYSFDIDTVDTDNDQKKDSLVATVTNVSANGVTKALRQIHDGTVLNFRSQMNDVSRRMGELRNSPEGYGAWARVYGGQYRLGSGMKEKSVTLQIGGDRWFSSNFYAGVMGAYTKADDTFSNGDNDQKNWNLGLYGGYFGENGVFWDATLKIGRIGNDFTLDHGDSTYSKAKYHTWGRSISLEGGWRFDCPNTGFYVEPQVEFMYGHLNRASYTDSMGITTENNNANTLVLRAGVATGYNFAEDRGNVYVKASVLNDSEGEVKTMSRSGTEVAASEGSVRDLGGTWGEFALGGTFKATKNVNLYGELMCTTKAAGVRTKWQGSAGVRYTF